MLASGQQLYDLKNFRCNTPLACQNEVKYTKNMRVALEENRIPLKK
jgi:hypothetical protein